MTDTQLKPTDAELDKLIRDASPTQGLRHDSRDLPVLSLRKLMRDAIAKWGHPAHSGEPVAWKHDCAALLTNDVELWIDTCPHCGKPRNAPQPTQAQAGAVPLTDEQIKDEASHHGFIGSTEMLVKFVRGIEAAHGIKGGQNADT